MPANHDTDLSQPVRRRVLRSCPMLLLFSLCSLAAAAAQHADAPTGGGFQLARQVIAGGGITRASSTCFDIRSTVAEAVVGSAQGGAFSLTAGFLADDGAISESLFRSGFESCQP